MTKIIELAHALGEEIAKSEEIKNLESAKAAYESDAELQNMLSEHETDRKLLMEEFSNPNNAPDERAVADLKARMEELGRLILANPNYILLAEAQRAMDTLMRDVNDEIKFCITGERPEHCTHDCSTCGGCH